MARRLFLGYNEIGRDSERDSTYRGARPGARATSTARHRLNFLLIKISRILEAFVDWSPWQQVAAKPIKTFTDYGDGPSSSGLTACCLTKINPNRSKTRNNFKMFKFYFCLLFSGFFWLFLCIACEEIMGGKRGYKLVILTVSEINKRLYNKKQ